MGFIQDLWPNVILGMIVGMSGPQVFTRTADVWTVLAFTVSVAWLTIHHVREYARRKKYMDEVCQEALGKTWDEVKKAK